jgi:pyruvate dehydrogenase E1 component beta subunit
MDEIANQAAKIPFMLGRPVPLVIRATAGIAHGGPQHNNSLESYFMNLPGMNLVVPAFPYDVKGLVKTALRTTEPVIFLMHKRLTGTRGPVGGPDDLVPLGQANIVRAGTDCTVITYGGGVAKALAAAETLSELAISAEIIDLRSLAPLDVETCVASVHKTGRAVVFDEGPGFAGPGAEVAATVQELAFEYLDAPVGRLGARRTTMPESPPLLDQVVPKAADVVAAVQKTYGAFQGDKD